MKLDGETFDKWQKWAKQITDEAVSLLQREVERYRRAEEELRQKMGEPIRRGAS